MNTTEIHNEIKKLRNIDVDEHQLTIHSFISTFNILQIALGTIIAFAGNKFIEDISIDIFQPIIKKILFHYSIYLDINIFGTPFNPVKILSSFIYFIVVIIFLYILYKYALTAYVKDMLAEEKMEKIKSQRYTLNTILYQKKTYDSLQDIKNLLEKKRKYVL